MGFTKISRISRCRSLNNTFITNHYSSEDPDETIQDLLMHLKIEYGESPNAFHALGYDTVYFIRDAIERAGSIDGEAIKKALAETKDLSLITGTFSVDEKHNPVKSATILEFVDGKQIFNSKVKSVNIFNKEGRPASFFLLIKEVDKF